MRVVVAHNFYGARAAGGESVVYQQEIDLLRANGHEVETLEYENAEIADYSWKEKFAFPFSFGFSQRVYDDAVRLFRRFRPEILHVHNYKYVMTPAVFQAAKDCGVKTALTLHNYRLICPGGQLRRGDQICEECLHRNPIRILWRSKCASKSSARLIQYAFYRETRALLLKNVDVYIALTNFARDKFIEGGLPADRIRVKSNFLFDPLAGSSGERQETENAPAIFVGRLASEKGVRFMIDAWRDISRPLIVVGDGPEDEWARLHAPENVTFVGRQSHAETLELMRGAALLIFPSVWYEGQPMTLLEACALGVPMVASDLGPRGETVIPEVSGLLYRSLNRGEFVTAVRRLDGDESLRWRLSQGARRLYEENFTPEKNIAALEEIYRFVLESTGCGRN